MSLPSEQNRQKGLSLSQLVQRNAQALETREQIPYQHTVYAIPEEWRKKEEQLLADAVQFQPTLYRLIEQLEEAAGTPAAAVVVTGENFPELFRHCRHSITYDHNLLVNGLFQIYKKTTGKNSR